MDSIPVVIEVAGGNAEVTFESEYVDVILIDWDNIKEGDCISREDAETLIELGLYSMEELKPHLEEE